MDKPTIDELLEQLEDARDSGREIDLEKLCQKWPELLEPLKLRWQRILQFDHKYGSQPSEDTRRESLAEAQKKASVPTEKLDGARLVMQTELHLERFHDRGGLGDVYRAADQDLSREVAVKLLRADRQGTSNREDFAREAQIIGRMNHPGIVSIHGLGETIDGRPFYTMPFLDGGTLRSRTAAYHRENSGALVDDQKDFRELIYRLVAICKTIAYAHSRGIVHRDLKAENILLGKYGETLVIDWGCASQFSRDERYRVFSERTLHLSGVDGVNSSGGLTLRYASPEQLHGSKPLGPESDIYSLGAILYLLATGRSPLENQPDEKVRAMVLRGEIPPPEKVKQGVPRPLSAICRKAMSLEPHERYENALQMADDLERYLADEPTSVCRLSIGMRMVRLVRHNLTASMILLGTLLVGTLLLMLAFGGQRVLAQRAEASAQHRLKMAAAMVSNVGGFEISRRLSLLEVEAAKPALLEAMQAVQQEPDNREIWIAPQNLIYKLRDDIEASGVQVDSVFLNDAQGIQIARAPNDTSIGKNYAYRQYFHGGLEDYDPSDPKFQQLAPQPSSLPIVSNAYVSTNKNKQGGYAIKTALSVPIVIHDQGNSRVIGRLGMSLKINELSIFDSLAGLPMDAVLVETRNYQWGSGRAAGLILDRFAAEPTAVTNQSASVDSTATTHQLQDAMPRMEERTLKILGQHSGDATRLIPNFYDLQVNHEQGEVACVDLNIPYRSEILTGWKVVFIEAKK